MVSRQSSVRLVAVLAALGAAPLAAQAPVRLSFADAVRRAAGEAPTGALATLRTDEADAQGRQARSAPLPSPSPGGVGVHPFFHSGSVGLSSGTLPLPPPIAPVDE